MIKAAISLGEFFKCSPFDFTDREDDEILNLHRETLVWLRERRLATGD